MVGLGLLKGDCMSINNIASTFWTSNSAVIIKIVTGIIIVAILVAVGWWYAGKKVDELTERLRNQAILDNRPLYDNLAILKDRTQQLEHQYGVQKGELDRVRRNQRGAANDAFNNPDKKVAASYFDNTIDSYISSK